MSKLSTQQQHVLDQLAEHEYRTGESTPVDEILLEASPDQASTLLTALEELDKAGLIELGGHNRDTASLKRLGVLKCSSSLKWADLGARLLAYLRGRISKEKTKFTEYTWHELRAEGVVGTDDEYPALKRLILTFSLSRSSSLGPEPTPATKWSVPAFLVKLRTIETLEQLHELLIDHWGERQWAIRQSTARLSDDAIELLALVYCRDRSHEDGRALFVSAELATDLRWQPKRFNRAMNVLENERWIDVDERCGSTPFDAHGFELNETGILACEELGLEELAEDPSIVEAELEDRRFAVFGRLRGEERVLHRTNLLEADLLTEIVTPHATGQAYILDGVEVSRNNISQLKIVEETEGFKRELGYVEFFKTRPGSKKFISTAEYPSRLELVFRHAIDKTSHYLRPKGIEEEMKEGDRDPKKVFVIHGRNTKARDQMEVFLRACGLIPVNFGALRTEMGGTPHVDDIVEEGMRQARGIIALFTPDEFAKLHPAYKSKHDRDEALQRWQARPNVIFEAGMAFGRDRTRVVFVLLGDPKLFTDVDGIHVLRPNNSAGGDRGHLRRLLKNMGCDVEDSESWTTAGDFEGCITQPPIGPSEAAQAYMMKVGQEYRKNGYVRGMMFDKGIDDDVHRELSNGWGLIKLLGTAGSSYGVTEKGHAWIMDNQHLFEDE